MVINQTIAQIIVAFLFRSAMSNVADVSGCPWIKNEYNRYYDQALKLLKEMAGNNAEDLKSPVVFPGNLYERAANKSAFSRLSFEVQVLREVANLFDNDHASSVLDRTTLDHFLNIIHQQKDGLQTCMNNKKPRWSNKLANYFKRLSMEVRDQKEAWEMIIREAKMHIFQAGLLTPTK
ncbi:interferon phi 4 [Phyllopteryx taeniolatus]|uniref:interferon phi 4 n=1 Tax=Phyllopteryx taeniolatus TaxID=161469 RepID=UPI002AD2B92C|nr:interferon phi 4 [Phyllopteryx taeniolatus]